MPKITEKLIIDRICILVVFKVLVEMPIKNPAIVVINQKDISDLYEYITRIGVKIIITNFIYFIDMNHITRYINKK